MTRPGVWGELSKLDAAVYAAIARMPTPGLDQALGRLSRAADFSKLWLGSASALAAFGGEQGRRRVRHRLRDWLWRARRR